MLNTRLKFPVWNEIKREKLETSPESVFTLGNLFQFSNGLSSELSIKSIIASCTLLEDLGNTFLGNLLIITYPNYLVVNYKLNKYSKKIESPRKEKSWPHSFAEFRIFSNFSPLTVPLVERVARFFL